MENQRRPIANTIRDQVYQILKEEICSGYYEPGHWLQENELAQRLQVTEEYHRWLFRGFSPKEREQAEGFFRRLRENALEQPLPEDAPA